MPAPAIIKALKRHRRFLISTHINPDPDALCSELAMAFYLKQLGKEVHIVNQDDIPPRYLFLPAITSIKKYSAVKKVNFDVAVVLDCGELDRIGDVRKLIAPGKTIVNIDHHITNDSFGHLNFVKPQASSTAEILFDLLKEARCRFSKSLAQLLYVGIMTDTGSFRYDSTTVHTHEMTAELMKFDFSVSDLYRRVYEQIHPADWKMFAKMVRRFTPLLSGRVVFFDLTQSAAKRFSPTFDLKDKIFTYLRAIRGVEVIAIFAQSDSRVTRVNFRSQGRSVNVAQLASLFGGGGHRKASGCVVEGNLKEAKKKVWIKLRKML